MAKSLLPIVPVCDVLEIMWLSKSMREDRETSLSQLQPLEKEQFVLVPGLYSVIKVVRTP